MWCRYRLRLVGTVQGVSLRWQISQYAQEQDLAGWIINLSDGTVKMEIEGEEDKVKAALDWVLMSGAGVAEIKDKTVEKIPTQNQKDFQILKE